MYMKRQEYIDFACCIAILEIVINHYFRMFHNDEILSLWQSTSQILSFSTAFFFFKSGLFFSYKLDERSTLRKICNRYFYPFIFFSIMAEPLYWINLYTSGVPLADFYSYSASIRNIFHFGSMAGNAPCWFLLSLFIILSIFNLIRDKMDARILIQVIAILFLAIHYLNPFPIKPCFLSHTLTGFFFFLGGRILRDHIQSRWVVISAIISLVIIIFCGKFSFVDIYYDKVKTGEYWIWPMQTLALIIVFCNICNKLYSSNSYICQKLSFIGENTMPIFVTHWPFILIMNIICNNIFHVNSLYLTIFATIFYLALMPSLIKVFNRERLRFLIGK